MLSRNEDHSMVTKVIAEARAVATRVKQKDASSMESHARSCRLNAACTQRAVALTRAEVTAKRKILLGGFVASHFQFVRALTSLMVIRQRFVPNRQ